MPRQILVTGGSEGSIHMVERGAENEEELQRVLLENPQLLPAEDMGLAGELLVIGRETGLSSGKVDLLCLSESGEIVIVEFKTGPQNPDFRHALAQVIDYGSDIWRYSGWAELDTGVVRRYLAHKPTANVLGSTSLKEAAERVWRLDEAGWEALIKRVDAVLATGDFHFVVAAQRFTDGMTASVDYLNSVTQYGRYFLVELVRLDGHERKAYAAQVEARPPRRSAAAKSQSKASLEGFLDALPDVQYRESMGEFLAGVATLGFKVSWGSVGASIRLETTDVNRLVSVGWVFPEGGYRFTATHVTLGPETATLAGVPTVAPAIKAFGEKLKALPGGVPIGGAMDATMFTPETFPAVKSRVLQLLEELKSEAEAAAAR